MAHVLLSSVERREPLTDAETVRLGRLLSHRLGLHQVAFPDAANASVLLRDCRPEDIPQGVSDDVAKVLGPFEASVTEEW